MQNDEPRRLKRFYASPQAIVWLFNDRAQDGSYAVRRTLGLPDGYRIVNVAFDAMQAAFCFVVEHPDFDPVEPHELPGNIHVWVEVIRVPVPQESSDGE